MDSMFERLLREKIAMMEDMRLQTMTDPGYESYAEYRYNLGYVAALRNILSACDDIQSDMRKD